MAALSNVHITCTEGHFASGCVTVDGIPMIGVTKVEWTLSGDRDGRPVSIAVITVDGATIDAYTEAKVHRAG